MTPYSESQNQVFLNFLVYIIKKDMMITIELLSTSDVLHMEKKWIGL